MLNFTAEKINKNRLKTKSAKRKGIKSIAMFLSIVMLLTCVPFNLLASATSADDGIISVVKELEQYRTE